MAAPELLRGRGLGVRTALVALALLARKTGAPERVYVCAKFVLAVSKFHEKPAALRSARLH